MTMRFQMLTIAVFMMALAGSACTASDAISKQTGLSDSDKADQALLIAGVEAADKPSSGSELIFYVQNESDIEKSLLIWNTPLERELSADVFSVTFNGLPVAYEGRMVKRSSPSEEDYRMVPAHERIEVQLDMADFYAMSRPGEYAVRFTPPIIAGNAQLNQQTMIQLNTAVVTLRVESR